MTLRQEFDDAHFLEHTADFPSHLGIRIQKKCALIIYVSVIVVNSLIFYEIMWLEKIGVIQVDQWRLFLSLNLFQSLSTNGVIS